MSSRCGGDAIPRLSRARRRPPLIASVREPCLTSHFASPPSAEIRPNQLTKLGTGVAWSERELDLVEGMHRTLANIKAAAESAG